MSAASDPAHEVVMVATASARPECLGGIQSLAFKSLVSGNRSPNGLHQSPTWSPAILPVLHNPS